MNELTETMVSDYNNQIDEWNNKQTNIAYRYKTRQNNDNLFTCYWSLSIAFCYQMEFQTFSLLATTKTNK